MAIGQIAGNTRALAKPNNDINITEINPSKNIAPKPSTSPNTAEIL